MPARSGAARRQWRCRRNTRVQGGRRETCPAAGTTNGATGASAFLANRHGIDCCGDDDADDDDSSTLLEAVHYGVGTHYADPLASEVFVGAPRAPRAPRARVSETAARRPRPNQYYTSARSNNQCGGQLVDIRTTDVDCAALENNWYVVRHEQWPAPESQTTTDDIKESWSSRKTRWIVARVNLMS